MYSNKRNVLQLVALLKAYNISNIIVCPGSRNAPVVHSVASDPFFTCHSVMDERSAGFYALGVIQSQGGGPVAVCCTSGSAVLNLAPAVAEAYYRELPLVIISADRPESYIGQLMGQTIPQPGVFRTLVEKSVQLPEVKTDEDEWYCNRLINEALLKTDSQVNGPVHINIPISEPLFEFTETELPEVRSLRLKQPNIALGLNVGLVALAKRFLGYKKRMFIIGQLGLGATDTGFLLGEALENHECVVLAEYLSNMNKERKEFITNFDALLYALPKDKWKEYAPDLLITAGGQVVSKRVKEFIKACPPKEHWQISPSGEVADTYQCLTEVPKYDITDFIFTLKDIPEDMISKPEGYSDLWIEASEKIPYPKVAFSDLFAVKSLMEVIMDRSALFLANSSSVRLAQLCRLNTYSQVFCNRGTSGIDGCVSTAVGYASICEFEDLVFLITGDLAFFYDMNILGNPKVSNKLHILLNNNGGGEIFYTLPKLGQSEALRDYIAASHNRSAKGWVESVGFTYLSASNEEELKMNLPVFMAESEKPVLMEVFTSKEENARILKDYYHSLKTE